ncbi:MAG TPA: hypothetical protein ENH82_12435 [bacterium]|nr:hypothetical protein [bacterium]
MKAVARSRPGEGLPVLPENHIVRKSLKKNRIFLIVKLPHKVHYFYNNVHLWIAFGLVITSK